MNIIMSLIFIIMFYLTALTIGHTPKKKVIIDTDIFSDVDDTSALLLACTNPNIDLLGVNINYPSTYSALATSSILGYYNHSHVPVGLKRPFSDDTYLDDYAYDHGEYASKVAYHWKDYASLPWKDVTDTWDPVRLYRKLLAEQEDQSVTIASIGFFDNLSGLLSSLGDEYSPLSGRELVETKVRELAIMGGEYPAGREFNFFSYNATATVHVVNSWPGPIVFAGFELGKHVYSGAKLAVEGPAKDPVKAAYQWYTGCHKSRESWDPLTVLYAIEGLGDMFEFANKAGHNHVFPNGSNEWRTEDGDYPQHYLKLATSEDTASAALDELFMQGAIWAASIHDIGEYGDNPSLLSNSPFLYMQAPRV